MVGFTNNATVTFVPFFATATDTALPGATASGDEPPGTVRSDLNPNRAESDRPETDRVIALKVAHALAALQVPILRTLEVSVHEGHVTLRGRVRTYYERQLANAHARRTAGVRSVRGDISVAG